MPKVMIIEDDNSMRFLLGTLLQMEGLQVIEDDGCGENDAIIGIMEHELPDAVYMDVHIGNKNGVDILKLIRNTPALNSIKILMSSGMDHSNECMQAGANSFIMKPFMPEDLIAEIKNLTAS
ncbi:MAG: response regulator [Chloroflexi bacterium]|nr:response regulator [Chloroflexota bacterium]